MEPEKSMLQHTNREKCALVEHVLQNSHRIDWQNVAISEKEKKMSKTRQEYSLIT